MLLTNDTPERLALLGIHARPAVNPANGSECALIRFEDRELAVQVGLTTWDAVGHMILTAAGEIQRNAHCFIDQDVVEAAAWQLDEAFPGLASEVIEAEFLERSTAVMRSLLRDEVSIRDFRRIVEAIKTFDSVVADSPEQIVFDERIALHEGAPQAIDDMEILTAAARKALRRSLSRKYSRGGSVLLVFVLDPVTIESRILDQLAGRGAMRDEDWELIGRELRRELEALPPARAHPAILTNATVAIYLRPKVTAAFPTLPILSYDEVAPEMNVQPMARISIG
jgi:type III secretion protein V